LTSVALNVSAGPPQNAHWHSMADPCPPTKHHNRQTTQQLFDGEGRSDSNTSFILGKTGNCNADIRSKL